MKASYSRRGETIRLEDLIKGVKIRSLSGNLSAEISGISYDSRKVQPGDLFAAIKGKQYDGALFIKEAKERGATAALSWRSIPELPGDFPLIISDEPRTALALISRNFYGRPDEKIKMVGVTGTNGKTSVCYFLEAALAAAGEKIGVLSTVSYRVGREIIPAQRTTPECPDILAFLKRLKSAQIQRCVMEVSSHGIALKRVHQIHFDQMIFTNLTRDHLDFHKDIENYFRIKAQVFTELDPDAQAIINGDTSWGRKLIELSGGKIFTYGRSDEAHYKIGDISPSMTGTRFTLHTPEKDYRIFLPLVGIPNVYNATAAFLSSFLAGYDPDSIIEGLGQCSSIPGRFEKIEEGQDFIVIVDYAHTDDALDHLLSSLREIKTGRIITVFGCGGNRDRTKRPRMGAIALKLSDFVIVTSDNPRKEDPETIIAEIESGMKGLPNIASQYRTMVDRLQAIREAILMAETGDIVVIAGKGHERYQEMKDSLLPFDDREIAARMIREKIGSKTQNATA